MARDHRIERARLDLKPATVERNLSTSERVELLVSDVLSKVSARLEEKNAQDPGPRKF